MPAPAVRIFHAAQEANKLLTSRSAIAAEPVEHGPIVVKWVPDEAPTPHESLVAIVGPDFCGSETEKKWFRGIRAYGIGQVRVIVFVDGVLIGEKLLQAIDDADHSRLFYLPRGTNGYQLTAVVVGIGGEVSNVEILFDPMGSMES